MNRIEELKETIAKAQAELESLQAGGKRWRAEVDEDYWVISFYGKVSKTYENGVDVDNYSHSIGNYFRTEAEGKHNLKRMIATQQLKDRIAELNAEQGWVPDWGDNQQDKFFPAYEHDYKKVSYAAWTMCQFTPIELIGSLETIETVIKEMPDQIKQWLGVG